MNPRFRLVAIGALLCLALGLTIFSAVRTVQAVRGLERSRDLALSGDVSTIRPWMTLPYIARTYHVPESYLLQPLHISDAHSVRHVTLYALAGRLHRTPDALVQQVRTTIQTYRQHHAAPRPGPQLSAIPPPQGRALP